MVLQDLYPVFLGSPKEEHLPSKQESSPKAPGLDVRSLYKTPEYLCKLDENVSQGDVLLPSHYADADYISFLHNLQEKDCAQLLLAC